MKGASVVAVTIGIVLVVIALLVSTTFIIQQKGLQKVLGNETLFNLYCSNITMKYGCNLNKMEEQELNKFLEICRWEFGNESIDPAKCIEKCGCSEKILDALNIFKKYTGIDCGDEYCHATQHGLYAQILKLINKEGIEQGNKVFYIDPAGIYHECFVIDTKEGFYIRFTDGSSYNCGDNCTLSKEPPDSTPGEKQVDFVSDPRNNKVYLKGMQGYVWECENCAGGEFPIKDVPVEINITKIEKPRWPLGGTGKFKFKVAQCRLSRPYPEIDIEVYVLSNGREKQAHSEEITYLDESSEYEIKAVAEYIDYFHTKGSKKGKGTVYVAIIVEEENKNYFDFSNIEMDEASYFIDFSSNGKYHYVFKCDLLPGENCSVRFPENIDKWECRKAYIRAWGYSIETQRCGDGSERNYTAPYTNTCDERCYFTKLIDARVAREIRIGDVKRILQNCDTVKFDLILCKGYLPEIVISP